MPNQKSLFLDTSTQIARHWHSQKTRTELSQQIKDCRLFCSMYVKCQYKATLLSSMIMLHNLFLRSETLLEAIQKATERQYSNEAGGSLTKGVLVLIIDIAYWISHEYNTFDEQIGRLEDMIEDSWEILFEESLEMPLLDETACLYAEGEPVKGDSGAYRPIKASCTKKDPLGCRIQQFWEDHGIQLEALANMNIENIKAEPKDISELQQIKEHAQAILKKGSPHGQRCTFALSDAVICIEATHCPEHAAVHSINRKHFLPLGEVLGIECIS